MSRFEETENIDKTVAKICDRIPAKNAARFKDYFNQLCWFDKNDVLSVMDFALKKRGNFRNHIGDKLAEDFAWLSHSRACVTAFTLAGANQNARTQTERGMFDTPKKSTALMQLASRFTEGDNELVKILSKGNAAINAKNAYGETALMLAVQHQDVDFVKTLVENGADVHAKNKQGMDIRYYAREAFSDDMRKYVKKLTSKRSGFNVK